MCQDLRDAAGPKSRLVLFEFCACPNPSGYPTSPGVLSLKYRYPLLLNLGQAARLNPLAIVMINIKRVAELQIENPNLREPQESNEMDNSGNQGGKSLR